MRCGARVETTLYSRLQNYQTKHIKLCPRGAHTCARPLFCCPDLDINPMTLKVDGGLDILKMYLHTENCQVLMIDEIHMAITSEMKKYENSLQGQRSRSHVTNFQLLLEFTVWLIPTKLHQFLISSFRDFVRTDARRDREIDTAKNSTCSQHSWRTCKKVSNIRLF